MENIDCSKCPKMDNCCQSGSWVDLDEAKRILTLNLKGSFHHLEKDEDFPSGYKVATSYNDEPCTFLTKDGLCSVHKACYEFKPTYCKEFPMEDGELAPDVDELCIVYQEMQKKKKATALSQKR